MIQFTPQMQDDLEEWVKGSDKWIKCVMRINSVIGLEAEKSVIGLKEALKRERGEIMDLDPDKINKMVERMSSRPPAPRLTPEQLNAIDLLILGKTDREVCEIVGVRRETVTRWHKNPFFIAELNAQREALWVEAKLRLKGLAHEAVNTLCNGLHSSDEKIAVMAAVHILKVVGLYGDWKQGFGPRTPEEATWSRYIESREKVYRGLRPDAASDWSTGQFTEKLAKKDALEWVECEYEDAIEEQKKELREYRKRAKAQPPQIKPVPLTIEPIEEIPSELDKSRTSEPMKA